MKRKVKKQKSKTIIIVTILGIAVIAVAGIVGIRLIKPLNSDETNICQQTVSKLEALENADITLIEKELQELRSESGDTSETPNDTDESSNSILSDIEIRQKFQGTVIIGDSITESIMEYGFLDTDVVISKRGLSIIDADEQLNTAISLYPSAIFLAFGSNDLELYDGNVEPFKEAYAKQVQKLKDALPEVPVYIHCILPLQDVAIERNPALSKYPEFNKALMEICEDLDCTFIDHSFILEENPSMYEPDGEHVIMDFYPLWLTYIAEVAGL